MDTESLISEVRDLILRHAKPDRIWLYGSRATGEATDTSDIDVAFEDKDFKEPWLIEDDLKKLPTLLKIDVKNIAHTEERFRQRVLSTGRVLYSAGKKLRCEDGIYNYGRALERFREALERKEALEQEGFGDIFLDLAVKRFEFTYEMSWKAIRRFLDYIGIEAKYPRACFKEAYAIGLLSKESVWLDMIEQRNLTSHVYSQEELRGILLRLDEFLSAFQELLSRLKETAAKD
ncbi:HI0074 family nucleotidyltransferase substrate-binding subunit [Citrifermentans bremense]|uniref:HI0074 family nucleotidyltransferase substrate-binding subunit n=1 Tax=Citrifermentans bremense TaxID=60035 RepID=UPI001CF79E8B|nr:HI0074 family nucleotidyltransferase substrate-binding subunit [Citrifermentans bremense]